MKYHMFKTINGKLFLTILLVIFSDILFFEQKIGWTACIFSFLIIVAILLRNGKKLKCYSGYSNRIIIITLLLSLSLVENFSILSVSMVTISLITFALPDNKKWQLNSIEWFIRVRYLFFRSWLSFIYNQIQYNSITSINKTNQLSKGGIFRGWLLPVAASIMFIFLFSDANPIIYKYVNKINLTSLLNIFDFVSIRRIIWWLISASICWKFIRPKVKFKKKKSKTIRIEAVNNIYSYVFTKDSIFRSLIIFNIIFLLQNVMDIKYLWVAAEIPPGFTLSQYAHKGAYTLIVTAILSAIFSLLFLRSNSSNLTKWLIKLWVGQNILLVISSIWRTMLYIEDYSLTYLRTASLMWMSIVALGLAYIIIKIIYNKSSIWLVNINVITVLFTLYISCFINFGYFISNYNVNSSLEITGQGRSLDIYYLQEIGTSSLPAINIALNELDHRSAKYSQLLYIKNALESKVVTEASNWRSWTYRKYRIAREVYKK